MFWKKREENVPAGRVSTGAMDEARRRWRSMYLSTKGLRLPAAVAGELARLTTAEMKVSIGGRDGKFLEKTLNPLMGRLRRELEYGLAEGSLVFKPYYDGRELRIDVVKGDCFRPTAWDSGGAVTGAVFVQEIKKEDGYYVREERHSLGDGAYRIENAAFKCRIPGEAGRSIPLHEVEEWKDMAESLVIENVNRPLFGFFRTPSANTTDPGSPLGVSVFAGAEELMEDADRLYKNLLWEFESGKRRLYVDVTAFERDPKGRPKLPDTELFRTIDVNDSGFFSEWSPELRNGAIQSGLNTVLQRVEFNCGLAYGTVSQPSYVEKTAEEIRSSKQRSYCFVKDLQRELEKALRELIDALSVWAELYGLVENGEYECGFEFDDSIVADRRTEYEERVRLTELGVLRPWELRAWYLGETETMAREALGE